MTNPDLSRKKKVALGMSGGVDSSLCAHLLTEQGYDVTGVFMECWRAPGCRAEEDKKDALKVALSLEIPFTTLDFRQTYKEKVVEYFFEEYQAGRTPNPDVLCNKEIKFGLFYDWAMKHGFEYVATGHYAAISQINSQTFLLIPSDQKKDQTYFLYQLRREQLAHILFPLQELTKKSVRTEAKKRNIHTAEKKDSVGICFIGDINVHSFLEDRLGKNPGEVIDRSGTVIGQHDGLWFYTIGQRSGFTINQTSLIHTPDGTTISKHNIPPFYVIDKIADTNQLVVGFGAETLSQLFFVENIHWINPITTEPNKKIDCLVRIRHTGELHQCQLILENNSLFLGKVVLDEPIKGIATGQSAVFYQAYDSGKKICLGGGIINQEMKSYQ